jgi:DNA-binding transcriptional ArsR family regulator
MWKSFSVWWGTVPSWARPVVLGFALGVALAIVRAVPWAVKQVKTLWKWNQGRHDGKVLAPMNEAARQARLEHPGSTITLVPFKIADIASELNRSQRNVYKSLRRLEAVGVVHEIRKGEWCLGSRTGKVFIDDLWGEDRNIG